jgi:hypothetical protein
MRRLLLVSALLLALLPAAGGRAQAPQLIGTVGPGFTIDLTDASGKHVDVLTAGRYELLVHDLSDIHNFVLGKKETGERPASTEVEFVGDMTFTVDLSAGHWVYACSPHFQTMFGSFTVLPATPAPVPAPAVTVKALSARLTATHASLSAKRVAAGLYAITVADRSAARSFRLVGPGVNRPARRSSARRSGASGWSRAPTGSAPT